MIHLKSHKNAFDGTQTKPDKNYWTEVVVFTSSNNAFGPTEISYLENRFEKLATNAERYKIKKDNDPSMENITEEKESVT